MTSCRCTDRTHPNHRDEPCENIGSEDNGLCKACDELTRLKGRRETGKQPAGKDQRRHFS
jgi:hypothetical protein